MNILPLLQSLQALPPETDAAIKQTAVNTAAFPWTVFSFIVALLAAIFACFSMVFAWKTLKSQQQTERNTCRLDLEVQKNLLIEMCRHLYRNMVCSYAIGQKMVDKEYLAYPSEEHLVKMMVNLEDIHDELFYRDQDAFFEISKLYVLLRNYNYELNIICGHLKAKDIDVETKRRDVATLLEKCTFLTKKIMDFINPAWPNEIKGTNEKVRKLVEDYWTDSAERRLLLKNATAAPVPYSTRGTVFTDVIFPGDEADYFLSHFNEDVCIEMCPNHEGGERIHMIRFAD